MIEFQSAARSDSGCVRTNNEDAIGAFPEFGVWCVADGMGGGEDGEIASAALVRMLGNALKSARAECVRDLTIDERVDIVRDVASETSQWLKDRTDAVGARSCGSTLVGVVADVNGNYSVFHAGDSRAYLFRRKKIEHLTRDHSLAEALHVRESKLPPQMRGTVLRAVGIESTVDLDISRHEGQSNDILLLCSDGLTRMVPDAEIVRILAANGTCESQAEALVAAANAAGGIDNVTVVVLKIGKLPDEGVAVEMRDEGEAVTITGG